MFLLRDLEFLEKVIEKFHKNKKRKFIEENVTSVVGAFGHVGGMWERDGRGRKTKNVKVREIREIKEQFEK